MDKGSFNVTLDSVKYVYIGVFTRNPGFNVHRFRRVYHKFDDSLKLDLNGFLI